MATGTCIQVATGVLKWLRGLQLGKLWSGGCFRDEYSNLLLNVVALAWLLVCRGVGSKAGKTVFS